MVLENSFDHEIFTNKEKKDSPIRLLFSGNLERFGTSRGIEKIIEYFLKLDFEKKVEFHIFGGPESVVENLKRTFNDEKLFIYGHLKRSKLSEEIAISHLGLLTNIKSTHSQRHTSPLKYFEYLGSGLKVLATEAPAHRSLPYQNLLYFFDLEDINSFEKAINLAIDEISKKEDINFEKLTIDYRIKKIIELMLARPEGLEPSTP